MRIVQWELHETEAVLSVVTRPKIITETMRMLCWYRTNNRPVWQSCAVAKSEQFWRVSGQSNLTDSMEDCCIGQSAVRKPNIGSFCCSQLFVRHVLLCPPEFLTFSYSCAWLWNWLKHLMPSLLQKMVCSALETLLQNMWERRPNASDCLSANCHSRYSHSFAWLPVWKETQWLLGTGV